MLYVNSHAEIVLSEHNNLSRPTWARVCSPLDQVVFRSIVKAYQSILSCLLSIIYAYLIVNVSCKVISK